MVEFPTQIPDRENLGKCWSVFPQPVLTNSYHLVVYLNIALWLNLLRNDLIIALLLVTKESTEMDSMIITGVYLDWIYLSIMSTMLPKKFLIRF